MIARKQILLLQHLFERTRPLLALLFTVASEFAVFLRQVQRGEHGNFKGIGCVRLARDVAHPSVYLLSE